jgi:hypothetical protein
LRRHKHVEALGIASTYLVGMNESGNQKGNLSYLAGTKKRSDCLIQLIVKYSLFFISTERGRMRGNDARALFLSNTAEESIESL